MATLRTTTVLALALAGCSGTSDPCTSADGAACSDATIDTGARDAGAFDASGRRDLGLPDTGAPLDLGPWGATYVGTACDPVRGCNDSLQCQTPLGDGAPPTLLYSCADSGTDGGVVAMLAPRALYMGGYCTNATLMQPTAVEGTSGACDPTHASDDPAMAGLDGCERAAKCVELPFTRAAPTDPPYVQCLVRCAAAPGGCRAGYHCGASSTCEPFGCQSDAECRLGYDAAGLYCLDPTSTATCDVATGACVGTP